VRGLASWLQCLKTKLTNQRPYDVALIDTFAAATLKELDYLNEAANQTR
jgi:predicted unusual protein kinase regulating ubiquinone biosynthesis (AarF/ABC1/UbiB family)